MPQHVRIPLMHTILLIRTHEEEEKKNANAYMVSNTLYGNIAVLLPYMVTVTIYGNCTYMVVLL